MSGQYKSQRFQIEFEFATSIKSLGISYLITKQTGINPSVEVGP